MERWVGRVALVTGAAMGIGASIARRLVAEGMKVVGADRRMDKLQTLAEDLNGKRGSLIPMQCDLSKDEEVLAMFAKIKKDLGGVDVCINNAGISHNKTLMDGDPKEWREVLDVNVVALCLCTRESIASMRERGVDDGHIIHLSSLAAHRVIPTNQPLHFYAATKHAVRALAEGMRQELKSINSNIRISCISPGIVETEFNVNGKLLSPTAAAKFYKESKCMCSEDIAATLVHILGAPPNVEINDVLIRPVSQIL